MDALERRITALEQEKETMMTLINTLMEKQDKPQSPARNIARVHPIASLTPQETPTVAPLPPRPRELRELMNIRENVHTQEVNSFGLKIFQAIFNYPIPYRADYNEFVNMPFFRMEDFLNAKFQEVNKPFSLFTRILLKITLQYGYSHTVYRSQFIPGTVYTVTSQRTNRQVNCNLRTIVYVTLYLCKVLNNNDLWRRVLDELDDAMGVCAVGVASRLMNAFSGFEDLLGIKERIDPRSPAERVGDLFSALSKKDSLTLDQKIAEGNTILTENGITKEEERKGWLDALV
jgi:hypothetical protein